MTENFLESLEQRIAPATLVDANTVEFHDAHGDLVRVSISKGAFSESDFTFDTGTFAGDGPQTLESLHLGTAFSGANLTISVISAGSGDGAGKAEIGEIDATGVKLGAVSIAGALGSIDAGDGKSGIKSLTADSLGMLTPADFGLEDRTSDVAGAISSLTIHGDFGGTLNVTGGKKGSIGGLIVDGSVKSGAGDIAGWIHSTGDIKSVTIGGSLDGSDANAANEAGIVSDGNIKSVSIGGSIEGGGFKHNGVVIAGTPDATTGVLPKGTGKITTVAVAGSVLGAAGDYSGAIIGWAGLGSVSVTHELHGGTGSYSGTIQAGGILTIPKPDPKPENPQTQDVILGGNLSKISIGEDVTGNDGFRSGAILTWGATSANGKVVGGMLGEVNVGGSLLGGDAATSGIIYGNSSIKKITIGEDIVGGDGADSGRITTDSGPIGSVIVHGSLKGGNGVESGTVFAGGSKGNITSVEIGGDIVGGTERNSGSVQANGNIGEVIVDGSLIGKGTPPDPADQNDLGGNNAGYIGARGDIKLIDIGVDILGGAGLNSGVISVDGNVGTLTVGGEVKGGTYNQSGAIIIGGSAKSISVAKSVTGTDYSHTGYIEALRGAGTIFVGGDLIGGDSIDGSTATSGTNFSGAIAVGGLTTVNGQTSIAFGNAKSITIGGDIVAGHVVDGILKNSGAVRVNGSLGALHVGGAVIGNEDMSVWITALVNPTQSTMSNTAIKSIDITEGVEHALIVAGVVSSGDPFFPAAEFARIGSITVGGDWTASSIAAGVDPGDDGYGAGDTQMTDYWGFKKTGLSKISSITIGGAVAGGAEGDQYGFVAQSFGKITINGVAQQIPAVDSTIDVTGDGSVKIHTVKKTIPSDPA
jgi:hypothetical protein